MTPGVTKAKTWRRDAQRNRDRIVASARVLIAREGIDASVEEITRHAGVGMGTLYRHFATKEELVDAVLEDALSEFVALAEQALAEEDAWTGFRLFLEQAVGLHAANRGLKDVVATREHGLKHARAMRARTRPLLRRLVERSYDFRPPPRSGDEVAKLAKTNAAIGSHASTPSGRSTRYRRVERSQQLSRGATAEARRGAPHRRRAHRGPGGAPPLLLAERRLRVPRRAAQRQQRDPQQPTQRHHGRQ